MNAAIRERIEQLLRGLAAHPLHADAIFDELRAELDRHQRYAALQKAARTQRPGRRGRPTDHAERDFEARVIQVLRNNGFQTPDTATAPAVLVLAALREAAGTVSDPRNAIRRATRRLRWLRALAARLERQANTIPTPTTTVRNRRFLP